MSIETEIAALTTATTDLLDVFNQQLITVNDSIAAAEIGAAALLDQQGEITGNYRLVAADTVKTFFVNNGAGNVIITVPAGLPARFTCFFIQTGTGDVSLLAEGTVLRSAYNMLKIKGQNYGAAIQQVSPTAQSNTYQLIGKLRA